jgi:hypothetical protein
LIASIVQVLPAYSTKFPILNSRASMILFDNMKYGCKIQITW